MDIKQIKPCPFCGSDKLCQQWCDQFMILCLNCSAKITDGQSEDECLTKWNKRTFVVTEN